MKTTKHTLRPLVNSLFVSSLFALLFLCVRLFFTLNLTFFFLAWNLILAWMPFVFSWYLYKKFAEPGSSVYAQLGLFLGWLFFFPNAPYLITDYVHLDIWYGVPRWYDIIMITSFVWVGLMLGFLSLYIIEQFFTKTHHRVISLVIVNVSLFLASVGVYIGRYLRWNSWDVITHPLIMMGDIANAFLNPSSFWNLAGMTMAFFLFMSGAYHTFRTLMPSRFQP